MKPFRTSALALLLMFTLSQCRCIRYCVDFVTGHSSRGAMAWTSNNVPDDALTLRQFIEASRGRGQTPEVLERRFQVADANDDGLLTPQEIMSHRVAAARNKEARR